ncbi:MAG: thioredoxin domain-containing protein [Actinomycetaceae bacterium]|nr:thioredoxin domain-containing protein [Actinomycetaceae bacterium]MDU0969964.1 thioredoxin domain-containing protein [Actinomycetaceae bacterium]
MASNAKSRRILIGALALVIVVCLVGAVIALVHQPEKDSADEASPTASPSATATDQAAPKQAADAVQIIKAAARNDPKDPRAKGKIDAPVLMIEMSDYSCPMCAAYYANVMPKLEPLVKDGTLRIEFHDYAIFDSKYNSSLGAVGGIAAADQGKFWEYLAAAEKLSLSEHPTWNTDLAVQVATEAGVPDLDKFRAGLEDADALQKVRAEKEEIASWGVQGTPAFFINDRFITGAQDPQVFLDTIKAAKADGRNF